MINLMIVDDEPAVLQGLSEQVPWGIIGVKVEARARNGREAMAMLEKHRIHILITDIKMPVLDGLELSRRVRQKYNEVKIIILSGFAEFSYAQNAMELGVKNYLLKPVDVLKLVRQVFSLKQEINRTLWRKQDDFIRRLLIRNSPVAGEIDQHLELLNIGTISDSYYLAIAELFPPRDDVNLQGLLPALRIHIPCLRTATFSFLAERGELIVVVKAQTPVAVESVFEKFVSYLSNEFQIDARVGISLPFSFSSGLSVPFEHASRSLE